MQSVKRNAATVLMAAAVTEMSGRRPIASHKLKINLKKSAEHLSSPIETFKRLTHEFNAMTRPGVRNTQALTQVVPSERGCTCYHNIVVFRYETKTKLLQKV